MVTKQVTACDVYGTTKDVQKYHIVVYDESKEEPITPVVLRDVDLSPRALARLVKKIQDGTTPPVQRKKE